MWRRDTRNRCNKFTTLALEYHVLQITANAQLGDHVLTDIPVLNPGDWFGKAWLLEIGGSYTPLFLVVEANSAGDAINELADNDRYGHNIIVDDDYLNDYPEDQRYYGPSGQVLDLAHLALHGAECAAIPFPCRYFGDNLPDEGILPAELDKWDWDKTPAEKSNDEGDEHRIGMPS